MKQIMLKPLLKSLSILPIKTKTKPKTRTKPKTTSEESIKPSDID